MPRSKKSKLRARRQRIRQKRHQSSVEMRSYLELPVREPNGRLQRSSTRSIGMTPEFIQRRKALLGIDPDEDVPLDKLRSQRAGVPLIALADRGLITECQREAGERYGRCVRRYRRLLGLPCGGDGVSIEIEEFDASEVKKIYERYDVARKAITSSYSTPRIGLLALKLIDDLCADDRMIRIASVNIARAGLAALSHVFGVSDAVDQQ